jgi:molybdopterin-guanine dinucleotide biosynthesis protein A
LKYSAIILSGGASKRFKTDKGLFNVLHKPMIAYVLERVYPLVDEVIIVTHKVKASKYSSLFPSTKIVTDEYDLKAVISGALTGFRNAIGKYSVLLPCDTPLVSGKVLSLLITSAPDHDAVIPRWPNGHIEPLQAVYRTKTAFKASMRCINEGKFKMSDMISKLNKVQYLSMSMIKQFNPTLSTFYNLNTTHDLEKIRGLLEASE